MLYLDRVEERGPVVVKNGRDGQRSREAILAAGERLFAEHGYERTSFVDIGRVAGVSRGMPSYFFGSKDGLYVAVLERVFAAREAFLDERFARALAQLPEPPVVADDQSLRRALEEAVDGYLAFLREYPTFVKLMEREALERGEHLEPTRPRPLAVHHLLVELLARVTGRRPTARLTKRLTLMFVSLLFFPEAHAGTLVRSLDFELGDPRARREWRDTVVDLLVHAVTAARE